MMTPDEQREIYALRHDLMRTISLYTLLYEDDAEAQRPYDRMRFEIDFSTQSLATAQTILRVLNRMTARNQPPAPPKR